MSDFGDQNKDNPLLQFARMIDEINALGLNRGQMASLRDSMGLTDAQIKIVMNRGTQVYDQIKSLLFEPTKAEWIVHEVVQLDEVWVQSTWRSNVTIEMPAALSFDERRTIARMLALLLNTAALTEKNRGVVS